MHGAHAATSVGTALGHVAWNVLPREMLIVQASARTVLVRAMERAIVGGRFQLGVIATALVALACSRVQNGANRATQQIVLTK